MFSEYQYFKFQRQNRSPQLRVLNFRKVVFLQVTSYFSFIKVAWFFVLKEKGLTCLNNDQSEANSWTS